MKPNRPKPTFIRSNAPALIAFVGIIGGWFLFGDILIVMVLAMFAGIFSIIGWATHTVAVKQRPKISLRTAMILMLVASACLWLNTRPKRKNERLVYPQTTQSEMRLFNVIHYGWPFHAVTYYEPFHTAPRHAYSSSNIPAIMLNTAAALALLIPLGYLCEKKLKPITTSKTSTPTESPSP